MNAEVWEQVMRAVRHGWIIDYANEHAMVLRRPWVRARRCGVLMLFFNHPVAGYRKPFTSHFVSSASRYIPKGEKL